LIQAASVNGAALTTAALYLRKSLLVPLNERAIHQPSQVSE
jgi:hypothetical protein